MTMVDDRGERIRKVLADLVAFDTVSDRSNLSLITYIEKYLASFGITGRRLADETRQKASLWVTIGPQDRPGLILSGHTDVVPVDRQPWTSAPFKMIERNGRLYGRGTADMKGFVAVCLAMVPEIGRARLKMPIHLAISYDEEVGCIGVRPLLRELAQAPVKPLGCFVGEPTQMQVIVGHKGKHGVRATFRGKSCHSSLAPNGVNAVEYAAALIGEIRRRATQLAQAGQREHMYDIPHTTLLTSIVQGGTALNIVPDECVVEFEARGLGANESKEVTDAIVAWAKSEIEPAMRKAEPRHRLRGNLGIPCARYKTRPPTGRARTTARRAQQLRQGELRHRSRTLRQHGRHTNDCHRSGFDRTGPQAGRIRRSFRAFELRRLP